MAPTCLSGTAQTSRPGPSTWRHLCPSLSIGCSRPYTCQARPPHGAFALAAQAWVLLPGPPDTVLPQQSVLPGARPPWHRTTLPTLPAPAPCSPGASPAVCEPHDGQCHSLFPIVPPGRKQCAPQKRGWPPPNSHSLSAHRCPLSSFPPQGPCVRPGKGEASGRLPGGGGTPGLAGLRRTLQSIPRTLDPALQEAQAQERRRGGAGAPDGGAGPTVGRGVWNLQKPQRQRGGHARGGGVAVSGQAKRPFHQRPTS